MNTVYYDNLSCTYEYSLQTYVDILAVYGLHQNPSMLGIEQYQDALPDQWVGRLTFQRGTLASVVVGSSSLPHYNNSKTLVDCLSASREII